MVNIILIWMEYKQVLTNLYVGQICYICTLTRGLWNMKFLGKSLKLSQKEEADFFKAPCTNYIYIRRRKGNTYQTETLQSFASWATTTTNVTQLQNAEWEKLRCTHWKRLPESGQGVHFRSPDRREQCSGIAEATTDVFVLAIEPPGLIQV